MSNTSDHDYIDSPEQLQAFCDKLRTRSFMAIDTEFLRENTYRPQLCLVQIKSDELLALIDTLAVEDLTPLAQLLYDDSITKVFHAAAQDLEIFYWLQRKVPTALFDTQIAAPLLGYADQISYANLVREILGVELPKAHTRADWTRRPLPASQIRYALDDVIYLEQLYRKMQSRLQSLGRLEWLSVEFQALEDSEKYNKPAREMWKKIRAAQKLKSAPLAVLQALAEWREIQARESNLPRNWLIKDDVLVDLARQTPDSVAELQHVRGLGNRVKKQFAERLIAVIADARERTPQPLPSHVKKKKISARQNAVVDVLSAVVNLKATELDINPQLLASRKILEDCVRQGDSSAIKGWRQPLIGDELQRLLSGQTTIRISNGAVLLSQV